MEQEIITPTQTETSIPEGTGTQETVQTLPTEQPQVTVPPKVEVGETPQTNASETRRKPSDYYNIRNIRRELRERDKLLNEVLNEVKTFKQTTVKPEITEKPNDTIPEFWVNPEEHYQAKLNILQKQFDEKIERITKTLEGEKLKQKEQEVTVKREKATETLFPKSDTNDDRTFEERVIDDPERGMAIKEIIERYKLGQAFNENPQETAELILSLYDKSKNQKNPNIVDKKLMGSDSKSSVTVTGNKKHDNVVEQIAKIKDEIATNPSLLSNEKYKENMDSLLREYASLSK